MVERVRARLGGAIAAPAACRAVDAAYLYVLPVDVMVVSESVAADAAMQVFGAIGISPVTAPVTLSTFNASIASVLRPEEVAA